MPVEDEGAAVKIRKYRAALGAVGLWVLCLGALLGVHFALVVPRGKAVEASQAELKDAADWFSSLSNAKSERERARLAVEREEMESRFSTYVFTAEQLSQLDFELRSLSEKNHLTDFAARHVRTTSKIGPNQFKTIAQREMILSFNSTFPDFLRFINDLERHYPVVIVDSFTPTAAVENGGVVACTLECSLLYETKASGK
jgi:hypothetical protein